MDQLFFVLSHYGALAALALLSYTFGRQLTRGVNYHSTLEQVSFSVALGLGVVSYLMFLLGLFNLLYRSVVLIALLAGFLMCYRIWLRWPADLLLAVKQLRATKLGSIAIAIAIAIFIFGLSFYIWILPLYPPTGFDSTMYHLTAAKIYARTHGLSFLEYVRLPIFPQASHMLFTLALLVYDDILAQQIEQLMLITLVATVVAFGKRMFSYRTGCWAAAILLAQPAVLWVASVAYIDMGVTLYTTTTVYAFWNWLESRHRHWLALAGAFCGISIGTKYSALFFLAAFTLAALFVGFKQRKWQPSLIFAGVALLVAAPWLVRNFYYTRNPLFPMFESIFGSVFGYGLDQAQNYRGISVVALNLVDLGRSWHYLLTLPWQLAFHKSKPFSPLYFFLLPLALVFAVIDRRIRFLLALTVGFTICWFFAFQQFRYLIPALPLMSLAVVGPIDRLLERLPLKGLWKHPLITAAGFAILMYPGWQYAREFVRLEGPLPITQQQRDKYLTERLPSYPAYKLLNRLKGGNYTVYALLDENMTYFADGSFKGDHFGPARYARIFGKLNNGQSLYTELKSMGADYFLVNTSRGKIGLPDDTFFQSHFKPIYDTSNLHFFELTTVPVARQVANLIQDAGFEESKNKQPAVWRFAGEAVIDSSGKQSFTGQTSVRSNRAADVIYQLLSINAGGQYAFSCAARAVKEPGTFKLQANWYDTQGRLLKEEIKLFEVGVTWKNYETSVIAPANATTVIVYASPLDPGQMWFDDFSFGTMTYKPLP